ncbi:MAG: helix-turn-helix transcriptional regulator [Oscillospiraceae bacterium]|nr:helix-turn-helix transcriptional regulator [Oscillospiraceae bacterium]
MNKEIENKVGNNVRTLREQKNLTQEYVASQMQLHGCDITRSALAKIEVGQRHLYPDEIILIKEILNISFDEIFDIK